MFDMGEIPRYARLMLVLVCAMLTEYDRGSACPILSIPQVCVKLAIMTLQPVNFCLYATDPLSVSTPLIEMIPAAVQLLKETIEHEKKTPELARNILRETMDIRYPFRDCRNICYEDK